MKKVLICLSVFLLSAVMFSGCRSPRKLVWVHPQKNSAGLKQDSAQCKYDIGMVDAQNGVAVEKQQELFNNCMLAKGWNQERR